MKKILIYLVLAFLTLGTVSRVGAEDKIVKCALLGDKEGIEVVLNSIGRRVTTELIGDTNSYCYDFDEKMKEIFFDKSKKIQARVKANLSGMDISCILEITDTLGSDTDMVVYGFPPDEDIDNGNILDIFEDVRSKGIVLDEYRVIFCTGPSDYSNLPDKAIERLYYMTHKHISAEGYGYSLYEVNETSGTNVYSLAERIVYNACHILYGDKLTPDEKDQLLEPIGDDDSEGDQNRCCCCNVM